MTIVSQFISQVRNQLRAIQADARYSNKFIFSIINKHARWLIKREADRQKIMYFDYLFQTLKCVDVAEAPAIDDCCGIKSKCTVMRTKDKLPKLYEASGGVIIRSVHTIDGSKEINYIKLSDYTRKLEDPNSKYDNNLYFFYNDGYLYFPKSKIKMVMIKAFFEDDIKKYNKCEESDEKVCTSKLDEPFFIPPYLEAELMDFVLKDIMNYNRRIQPDQQIDKNELRIT